MVVPFQPRFVRFHLIQNQKIARPDKQYPASIVDQILIGITQISRDIIKGFAQFHLVQKHRIFGIKVILIASLQGDQIVIRSALVIVARRILIFHHSRIGGEAFAIGFHDKLTFVAVGVIKGLCSALEEKQYVPVVAPGAQHDPVGAGEVLGRGQQRLGWAVFDVEQKIHDTGQGTGPRHFFAEKIGTRKIGSAGEILVPQPESVWVLIVFRKKHEGTVHEIIAHALDVIAQRQER